MAISNPGPTIGLTATATLNTASSNNASTNIGVALGQTCYWEVHFDSSSNAGSGQNAIGARFVGAQSFLGFDAKAIGIFDDVSGANHGTIFTGNTTVGHIGFTFAVGDVISVYLANKPGGAIISWRQNGGNWNSNVSNSPTVGATSIPNTAVHEWLPAVEMDFTGAMTIRVSPKDWSFAAPVGAYPIGANV